MLFLLLLFFVGLIAVAVLFGSDAGQQVLGCSCTVVALAVGLLALLFILAIFNSHS
jgi:hypothetical protein